MADGSGLMADETMPRRRACRPEIPAGADRRGRGRAGLRRRVPRSAAAKSARVASRQAAIAGQASSTTSATRITSDARRPRGDRDASGRRGSRSITDRSLHELFSQHRPYNNLRQQPVLACAPAFAVAARRRPRRRALPARGRRHLDKLLARLHPPVLRSRRRSIVTSKTPRPGGTSSPPARTTLRRRDDGGISRVEERYALNSRLVKCDGRLVEEVYRVGGRYSAQIEAIVAHPAAAIPTRPS